MPAFSWEADPVHHLARLTRADLDPDQRYLLDTGTYSLTALSVPLPQPRLLETSRTLAGSAEQAEAAAMDRMARGFADYAEAHGGASARTALTAFLAHDVVAWLHAPADDAARRCIQSAAAQLTVLLGEMCADSGTHALAQHYHQTAASLAETATSTSTSSPCEP
ncbi:hypothetical protein O7599_11280 [Streptomyces sp. WMMC500]|uniref:hypothetical protein n=1 Tax=Streptomyces sp. WMMC500 TaxID=3015154 RepID=UPI00248CD38A|nr:hypothetical protein [Streptomyces sp. WMMC500]WBB63064.1 hypothetical protein O7599_11280 [Streptomyces sp. WMMC500]